jgi:hypothetical protein
MSLSKIDYEPIQEIQCDEVTWYWHIVYTANNWRTTHEMMLDDHIILAVAKEAGLHQIDEDGIQLTFTDAELLEYIILFEDIDFLPIVAKIHELRKNPSWKKKLKTI